MAMIEEDEGDGSDYFEEWAEDDGYDDDLSEMGFVTIADVTEIEKLLEATSLLHVRSHFANMETYLSKMYKQLRNGYALSLLITKSSLSG